MPLVRGQLHIEVKPRREEGLIDVVKLSALPLMGVYALVITVPSGVEIVAGGLGKLSFKPGVYVYVGSALKPGLVLKRVLRHLKREKRLRWHVDYLLVHPGVHVEAVVAAEARRRAECDLAACLLRGGFAVAVARFGSSDCRCPSHLLKPPASEVGRVVDAIANCLLKLGLEAKVAVMRGST